MLVSRNKAIFIEGILYTACKTGTNPVQAEQTLNGLHEGPHGASLFSLGRSSWSVSQQLTRQLSPLLRSTASTMATAFRLITIKDAMMATYFTRAKIRFRSFT